MKTIQVTAGNGLDRLTLVNGECPQPQQGQILVKWHATSLNYHDYLVANGTIPVVEGMVPMSDGAGEVVATGDAVSQWKVGDKVLSLFFPALV